MAAPLACSWSVAGRFKSRTRERRFGMPIQRKPWRKPAWSKPTDGRKGRARNMATKKTPVDRFRKRLDGLSHSIPDDLRLPSLEENRLEGYAYLFRLVLPLLNAKGKRVFTDPI